MTRRRDGTPTPAGNRITTGLPARPGVEGSLAETSRTRKLAKAVPAASSLKATGQTPRPPKVSALLKPGEVHELFSRLAELNPHPTTELVYSTPFELLVAVILSAQATDVGVNKATRRLSAVANTPAAILALGESGLKPFIATIGLFKAKANNVIATCRVLVEQYAGAVPNDRAALESLPGVGRKTANVVLNTAFGQPTIAVDTHIFRVSNRTGLAPGKDVRAVEDRLIKVVPDEFKMDAHHWLILHGRYVCKARKPDCPQCIIRDLCRFRGKTTGMAG